MAASVLGAALLFSSGAWAVIAPECVGVQLPENYDEETQRAYLQNYFAAAFLFSPLSPPLSERQKSAEVGLELTLLPPLACVDRLVRVGDVLKTENTNLIPVLPRPRLKFTFPKLGPVLLGAEIGFIPPIPLPFASVAHLAAAISLGYPVTSLVTVGARGHFEMTRVRADLATAFNEGDPAYDDAAYFASFGGDAGVSYRIVHEKEGALTPYLWAGYGQSQTLFIVGDTLQLIQNATYPWRGATVALGAELAVLDERLVVSIEGRSAIPVFMTLQAKVAWAW